MENHATQRFRRFMEALEDSAVPTSRLIEVINRWIENEYVEPADQAWLNDHCGARVLRMNPPSPVDPSQTVVEHYEIEDDQTVEPKTMPMRELEAAAVHLFLEYLQEYYRKHDDTKRPLIKRCVCCERLFRTFQGYPDRVTCSKSCTHKNWQQSRGLEKRKR
ncbi:MAG: hypothetical protein AAF488_17135 [Planctomycetota bacterium]